MLILLLACTLNEAEAQPEGPVVIGITGATEALIEAVEAAGAVARPILPTDEPHALLQEIDGLILGPGGDLDPAIYGQPAHSTVQRIDGDRERQDLALAALAYAADLPTIGICLGAQEMVVANNGSLIQDIPSQVADPLDHRSAHAVEWLPQAPLALLFDYRTVDSAHHQAADALPPRLEAMARSSDGVVEAFHAPGRRLYLGLQFHAENHETTALWSALVDAAGEPQRAGPVKAMEAERPLPVCRVIRTPFDEDERAAWSTFRGRLGSRFGDHRDSYLKGHKHAGVDLKTTYGERVLAICPGEVADIHLGFPHLTVVVEHEMPGGERIYSSYKHIEGVNVRVGDRVHEETEIGRVFTKEQQKEAPWGVNHLHFEMRTSIEDNGAASWTSMTMDALREYATDPVAFFKQWLR